MNLDAKIPSGPLAEKWTKHRFDMKLVNPANKRKYTVIVVGSGLAGGAAAATMGALDRGPGRHQRGQELPERRRLDLPPLLRHPQGRRLPRPRGQRLPARRGQ